MKIRSSEFANCLPFMTITADHQITVLGKNLIEDEGSPSNYREYSNLRYNSRPGDAGSFLAKSSNGANSLPCVPAVFDTKNDRVYALQNGNIRLTCWNAWKSSGPEEKSAQKIHLDYPAVSMSLLPMSKGIIYGSCLNGTIFIARVVGEKLSVEYIQVNQPQGTVHIGTFGEIDAEHAKTSGRKRKMVDADGNFSVNIYQVYCDGVSIKILRNNVSLSIYDSDDLIKAGSLIQNETSINLINDELIDGHGNYVSEQTKLLISSSGSSPKISVVYTIADTTNEISKNEVQDPLCGTFCAAISLESGDISSRPVKLPSQMKQFGLVAETVVAAASDETISLYDLMSGSILQSISLKRIKPGMDESDDWMLHTNDRLGILGIVYQKEDHLHVALSTASLDGSNSKFSSTTLNSSTKLVCSLLASQSDNKGHNPTTSFIKMSYEGTDKDSNSSLDIFEINESVAEALSTLEETREIIISKDDEATSFQKTFDACISDLKKAANNSNSGSEDSFDGELGKSTKRSRHEKLNGKSRNLRIPTCIPQSFVNESAKIVLSIILRERKETLPRSLGSDARQVLKDLIQSKRLSARHHFEGSYALQETTSEHPLHKTLKSLGHPSAENPLSAIQMILEMIFNCSDLSERHLVIMLDYMLRHAKADGIVDMVRYQYGESLPKEYSFIGDNEKKTIIAGVKAILQMVVGYSECNDAMLRVALSEELTSSAEAIILARMLPNLLVTNPYSNRGQNLVRSTCQWIAALSESFRDDLEGVKTSSGDSCLSILLKSVEKITKNSQAVMSLKDSIGVAGMINRENKVCARKGVNEGPRVEEAWGYSIDHIVF